MHRDQERTIVYAGASHRRMRFLESIPETDGVTSVGGGQEPDTSDVSHIAQTKLIYGLAQLGYMNGHVVTSADTRTETQGMLNNIPHYISKGKPKNLVEVAENFERMSEVAHRVGKSKYRVISSSYAEDRDGRQNDTVRCDVEFRRNSTDYLATAKGFQAYVQKFNEFYSTPPYSTNNLPAISLESLSGGLSLPVLLEMKLVESINGVQIQEECTPEIMSAARAGIFAVAVGFGPRVLEKIHPKAMDSYLAWSWLDQVVQKALGPQK